jgi:hypothetical protein
MERTADLELVAWRARQQHVQPRVGLFVTTLVTCACVSALFATWLPLQISIITVFLFAGPHNWFELRYFLTRLPVRFGKSRPFFLTAFAGIGLLTIGYIALPLLYSFGLTKGWAWSNILAVWNSLLLLWLGVLVWMRGKQKLRRDWTWAIPVSFGLISLNWLSPQFFSLAIVYLHPLVALWFLDRHLRRTRPEWLSSYHRCVCFLPVLLVGMIWYLSQRTALPDDNGLFWRITQHAGAELLPGLSPHMLVSVHVFLEILHYGVWLLALPLITVGDWERGRLAGSRDAAILSVKSIPLARHPRGFPKLVGAVLLLGVAVVVILWFGFSMDYSTTRDIYFTLAIAHVLAEAPFLLRMI